MDICTGTFLHCNPLASIKRRTAVINDYHEVRFSPVFAIVFPAAQKSSIGDLVTDWLVRIAVSQMSQISMIAPEGYSLRKVKR